MILYTKFKVRVNYRSGIQETFWVWEMNVKTNVNGVCSIKYKSVNQNRPVDVAACTEFIESVWTLETKRVFRFTNPCK